MTSHSAKRMSGVLRLVGTLAVLSFLAQPAQAAMRCGNKLVTSGDHKLEVLHKCGPPALKEYRGFRYVYVPHHMQGVQNLIGADIEEWTYNFGPRRFMRLVRFANSKVVRVISLDYGH